MKYPLLLRVVGHHALWVVLAPLILTQSQTSLLAQDTIRVRTQLVTVPVVVTDKSGTPRRGLKKEEFLVLEDGKEQKIANFEEIEKTNIPALSPSKANQFTNIRSSTEAQLPFTILVLDLVNTAPQEQIRAKEQILQYLRDLRAPNSPTALFSLTRDGVKVLHDFTTDTPALAASLKTARHDTELVEQASQEALPPTDDPEMLAAMQNQIKAEQRMESTERRSAIIVTMQGLQQIAHSCEGLPGRKALLWATSGFPFSVNPLGKVMNIHGVKGDSIGDVQALYDKTWRLLNHADVSVYPVDIRGMVNSTLPDMSIANPSSEFRDNAVWMQDETIGTLLIAAQQTGGIAFANTNDLKSAFAKASDDNAHYYLLSYYLNGKHSPGWHSLSVKVSAEGGSDTRAQRLFLAA